MLGWLLTFWAPAEHICHAPRPRCDEMPTITTKAGRHVAGVGLTFLVLLFGAALMANVTAGPMRDYRGSWVTHASK